MKEMRNVANDQKAEFGKTINGAKVGKQFL